jgi:hypothetical protein
MQSVFNTALLARLRRQTAETFDIGFQRQDYDQNTDGADEPDSIPVTVGDPNNDIDPDDVANPDVVAPPPPMPPCAWWVRMVLSPDQTPVTPTAVQTVFEFIGRRLAATAPTGAFQPPGSATAARLSPSEGLGTADQRDRALQQAWSSIP